LPEDIGALAHRLALKTRPADGELLQLTANRGVSENTEKYSNTGNIQKRRATFFALINKNK
jgi:hypothetical protein